MNSSGVRDDISNFKIADDINHAGFALDAHPRALRDSHRDINSIRSLAHYDFIVGNVNVAGLNGRAD